MSDELPAPAPDPRTRFLEGLAAGMSVTAAAALAGVHRDTAYGWKERDADFAKAWEQARDAGTDRLEDEGWRRAFEGTDRPVFQGGQLVGHIREYSDNLLMFLLRGRRPEYRDNAKLEVSGNVTLTHLVEQAAQRRLEQAAQRRLERAKLLELEAERT